MILKDIAAKNGLFLGVDNLYSVDNTSLYISDKKGEKKSKVEFIEDTLNNVFLKYSKETIAYVIDGHLKVVYIPTNKLIINTLIEEEVSSLAISPSGMNVAVGFSNGKTTIYNNLSASSLGKFTLFSDGSAIEYLDFLDDGLMIGATQERIVVISLLKKGAVARVDSLQRITAIYSSINKLVYTTQKNEIYLVDLKDFKQPNKSMLQEMKQEIVDIKFNTKNSGIFIATKTDVSFIELTSSKLTPIKSEYSAISTLLLDQNSSLYIGEETSCEFLPNPFDLTGNVVEVVEEEENKKLVRFLTVDDSTTIRLVIKKSILNNFKDVEVAEARDGLDALDYLKKNPQTDVIFLDWNMPNMNGDRVVEEISKMPELKHVKIIMATTEGGKERVKQMISKGVIGYLVKPLRADSINPLTQKMIEMVLEERASDV